MQQEKTPEQIISERRIFDGPYDSIRALNYTRYPWAHAALQEMRNNEWKPEEVSLIKDKEHFKDLTEGEQLAYKRGLAFLSNLDAIQVENLAENIGQYITDPDIKKVVHRQVWEEQLHVLSYSQIVETVIDDPMEVYDMSRQVSKLAHKNTHITAQGKLIHEDKSPPFKIKAIVSNIILEGIYFYSGFTTFYVIGNSRGTINGTVDMIRYIHRDEISHLRFFTSLYNAFKAESPEHFTASLEAELIDLFKQACEIEIGWGEYLIEGGVLGLTPVIIRQRIQYLTEVRANAIGLSVYPGVVNPLEWVDRYAQINNTLTSFFESKPKTYSRKTLSF